MTFGRLERAKGGKPMSEINVTPLVDVMLVLVVIFILTAPLLASSIKLDLPNSDAAKAGASDTPVTVVINRSGQVYFNERAVSADELSARLQEAARIRPETEVHLRADEAVPYGKVVEVMGAAQKAGLSRIGFAAEPAPAAPR
jgi:biopolymer transport protein TolR